jgi:glycine C-acetyltransferase
MTTTSTLFFDRSSAILAHLEETGQLKQLQMIESPMGPRISIRGKGEVDCFCSNNYLGLANHPDVVEAGIEGLRKYGAGTASVRFICGTFAPHEALEERIASFLGVEASYTFVSCWNATEATFPTLCQDGDVIVSDELNHACIIDSMRLTTSIHRGVSKCIYKHSDMESLREALVIASKKCSNEGSIFVITDGVFSMEGDIALLPDIRSLCNEFCAVLVVDDSHGTGVMGETGRGTHEHYDMAGNEIDIFTGTLGKALGGGAGGYVAGKREAVELLMQRGRPTLFSNALPVTVACSAKAAIDTLDGNPSLVQKLRANVAAVREGIGEVGFEVLKSPTAICPIIVGETATAISMSNKLLDMGVFAIGFGYPVVPEGAARIRVQVSAAHEQDHIDRLCVALSELKGD